MILVMFVLSQKPQTFETFMLRLVQNLQSDAPVSCSLSASVHPSRADSRLQVRLEDAGRWQNYSEPGQLQMTWDRSLLRAEKVNIELWGYREVKLSSGAENASTTAQLSYLYSIGRNVSNSGDFRFTPEPRADFSSWELGNIRITSSFQLEGER